MTLSMTLFTFINTWWIMLFFVWPFAIVAADRPTQDEYAAAPKSINWKRLLVIDTLVSIAVTAGLAALMGSGVVSLRG